MTGKIVNLRQARKRKIREVKSQTADENAAAHGRSKSAIDLSKARAEKEARDLDGHKRD